MYFHREGNISHMFVILNAASDQQFCIESKMEISKGDKGVAPTVAPGAKGGMEVAFESAASAGANARYARKWAGER